MQCQQQKMDEEMFFLVSENPSVGGGPRIQNNVPKQLLSTYEKYFENGTQSNIVDNPWLGIILIIWSKSETDIEFPDNLATKLKPRWNNFLMFPYS